jgi:hypothetical protein
MDKLEKHRKIRRRLELASYMIALIIGNGISSCLGIHGKKFISLDTALNLAIIVVISIVLNNISIKIADNWYNKNSDK